jgi:hypothetical protein
MACSNAARRQLVAEERQRSGTPKRKRRQGARGQRSARVGVLRVVAHAPAASTRAASPTVPAKMDTQSTLCAAAPRRAR